MNILLLASHGIAEYDDIRMFHHLGFEVFCPGGYANPAQPGETLRPALPDVPSYPNLAELCDIQRAKHPEPPGRYIDWAKADLHPDLIDWADVIIVHHFVREWIAEQWPRIAHKRVVWRTCGQSDPSLELDMAPFHRDGLQIVRYSPAEKRYFGALGTFAGEDALIRFGKFPNDYGPWIPTGTIAYPADSGWEQWDTGNGARHGQRWGPYIGNITQNMVDRGEATGLSFWLAATEGLPARPAGPGSEKLPGGIGALSYDEMLEYLRRCRAYLYTGTQPASYTLGLIEAMLSGVPVVSIGKEAFGCGDLFEGHEITALGYNDPAKARDLLDTYLYSEWAAKTDGAVIRQRAIDLFGIDTVGPQWMQFLEGLTTSQVMQRLRIAV